MRPDDFSAAQRRHVVRAERGYSAFLPPPLPPPVRLDGPLVLSLSRADRALGELAGVGRSLPNQQLLAGTLARREAVLSSRIEGTLATLSELALFEVEPSLKHRGADVREVANYVAALDHVLDTHRRLPVSLPLLLEAHDVLLQGVGGNYATPGAFRRSQNWIGPPGAVLENATYVPPPAERLWECLDPFEKYLHAGQDLPPLLRIAAVHYQFEAIHPFLDGNGRVGRLLVTLLMVEWGLLPGPLLDLSAWIEPRRDDYYEALLMVSVDGDWAGWLHFFLAMVAEQSTDAAGRAHRLQALRDELRAKVVGPRASALLPALVDELFRVPAITIARARSLLGVSHRAALLNLERLRDEGVLEEVPRVGRQRLFVAASILAAVEGRDRPLGP